MFQDIPKKENYMKRKTETYLVGHREELLKRDKIIDIKETLYT